MILEDGSVRKRRKSYDLPGHAHFLTFSCHRRLPLLDHDETRTMVIESLDAARRRRSFSLLAFVIMPEHVHALVFPRDPFPTVASILQSIKQPVAVRGIGFFNRFHPSMIERLDVSTDSLKPSHRFWQRGGGYDSNITSHESLAKAIEYVHDNPVRRRLVKSAEDWPWSSARHYAGRKDSLLEMDPIPR